MKLALVVDDSMLIRHTVCSFLEDRGYNVEAATNGQEAMEILGTVKPDLIVTDMEMPHMTGAQLIEALKAKPETACIPVIILEAKKAQPSLPVGGIVKFVIHKDIDIEEQLQKALNIATGAPVPKKKNHPSK